MANDIHDFEPMLRDWCRRIEPRRVLEWGPGRSTEIIHEECPEAQIVSVEHDSEWFRKALEAHGDYADVHHVEIAHNHTSKYSAWPLVQDMGPFDLIFIDGRRRVECLAAARQLLEEASVAILHDANRNSYRHGTDLLTLVESDGRTAVYTRGYD